MSKTTTALPARNTAWPVLWVMTLATTSLVIAAPLLAQRTARKSKPDATAKAGAGGVAIVASGCAQVNVK